MVNLGPTEPHRLRTCPGFWPDRGTRCLRPLRGGTCSRASDPDHIGGPDLDPRWDWTETGTTGEWVKGACRHITPEPVTTADPLTGDTITVARLCPDCDEVLWRWGDDDLPEKNGFEKWLYPPPPPPRINPDLVREEPRIRVISLIMDDPDQEASRVVRRVRAWHLRVWNRIKRDPAPVILCLAMWFVIALNSGWVK